MPWTRDDADHLLRRAGFGGSLGDVDRYFALGQAGAIDALVNYESTPDPIWSNINPLGFAKPDANDFEARANLLCQLYTSSGARPLHAKLLWFWHGHLTTSFQQAGPWLFRRQMELYRANATGDFGTFLTAAYKDAAMLNYLNGNDSYKLGPNQNFARECLELFTLGAGAYTENDVREAARAFTGWFVEFATGQVQYKAYRHDDGQKTILGQTGYFTGDDLIALLVARPETPRRIVSKLYMFFVNEQLNLVDQSSLIEVWNSNSAATRPVVRSMLTASSFWDAANRWTLMKTPLDYGLGLLRRFEISLNADIGTDLVTRLSRMGYWVFDPPNVGGYRARTGLTGASMLLARYQFAAKVINDWASETTIARFGAGLPAPVSTAALIDQVASRMGSMPLGSNTRQVMLSYLGSTPVAASDLTQRTRDVAFLIACCAEYQLM